MTGESVAVAAERRWGIVVGVIIASLVAVMIVTGLHWSAMPPSRVETIDARTLHVKGEFVEGNLGTSVSPDGKVVVRLIAQQYSFQPACLLVPAGVPVTFRGTSTDVIHGFLVAGTNANVMLVPRVRGDLHHDVQEARRPRDAVPRVLRQRPRRHVGTRAGHPRRRVPHPRRPRGKGLLCSSLGASCSRTSGSPSRRSPSPSCWANGRCT
jgi:hypothetical protein